MQDKFQQIVAKVYPGAQLKDFSKLEGGVSAQVFALEVMLARDETKKLVLRQYGEANLLADPHVATHEHKLLSVLYAKGLPVPYSYYTDESCQILPSPYLVVEFLEGQTVEEPPDMPGFVRQMAGALARIHAVDTAKLPFLPNQQENFTKKLATKPDRPDESLSESRIRGTLAKHWPPTQRNQPVLLHGDFWPGNTMWKDDKLVGVIDWEDAGIGDPLADLGNGRLEILMFFGVEAAEAFTNSYKSLMPDLDYSNLPFWDLCAALRPAGKMASWGLDNATLHKLQVGHKEFVEQALAMLPA
jgi:aminoglycoside phosphotransferase (APT) family kinase protein